MDPGRHDTLRSQLEFYLSSQTIDDLYERVLERLENDGSGEAVRKVMTAIWASRAGLSETELLAITELAPLQWAPIDLALEKAFGRNGNRLVFDHDYLRIAVEDRYLPNRNQKQRAHEELAHWFALPSQIDLRIAEELPWQLGQADLKEALMELLLDPKRLSEILSFRQSREIADIWRKNASTEESLDYLLELKIGKDFENNKEISSINKHGLIGIANLLDEMGLHRSTWLKLRKVISQRPQNSAKENVESLLYLSDAYHQTGMWTEALDSYGIALTTANQSLGNEHSLTLTILNNLGNLHSDLGNETESAYFYEKAFEKRMKTLGEGHPDTLRTMNNLANTYSSSGDTERAEYMYLRSVSIKQNILGSTHRSTINGIYNLAIFYDSVGKKKEAEAHYLKALDSRRSLLGENHRDTLMIKHAYGVFLSEHGNQAAIEDYITPSFILLTEILGVDHPDSLHVGCALADIKREGGDYGGAEAFYKQLLDATSGIPREETRHNRVRYSLAECLSKLGRHKEAIEHRRIELAWCREKNGDDDPGTLESMSKLAWDLQQTEEYNEAVELHTRVLEKSQTSNTADKADEMSARYRLAGCLSQMGRHKEAVYHRRIELAWCIEESGDDDPGTLESMSKLAWELQQTEEYEEAIRLHMKVIETSQSLNEVDEEDIMWSRYHLATCLSQKGRHKEAIEQRRIELDWCREHEGIGSPGTITSINSLAANLREVGELREAEALFREVVDVRKQIMDSSEFQMGRALGGLARTLEDHGRLEESLKYSQQALEHRKSNEGCDTWWTNHERLGLVRVLQKLGRYKEASALLTELQESMSRNTEPDDADRQLITEAEELASSIEKAL
jgi:tetratricopeptide (TPR) repeat protein